MNNLFRVQDHNTGIKKNVYQRKYMTSKHYNKAVKVIVCQALNIFVPVAATVRTAKEVKNRLATTK